MIQRKAVSHEEGPVASRRVRLGRDAQSEPSRLHLGAQRKASPCAAWASTPKRTFAYLTAVFARRQ